MPATTVHTAARAPHELELPALAGVAGSAHLARNCVVLDRTFSTRDPHPHRLVSDAVRWCRHCAATAELMAATAPGPDDLGPCDTLVALKLPAPSHRTALVFATLPGLPAWPLQLDPAGSALDGTRGWVLAVPAATASYLSALRAFNPPWTIAARTLPDAADASWLRALTAGLLATHQPQDAVACAFDLARLDRSA